MKLLVFILILFSQLAIASRVAVALEKSTIPHLEVQTNFPGSVHNSFSEKLDLLFPTLTVTAQAFLVFILMGFAFSFYILARNDRAYRSELFLAIVCVMGAFLNFPASPTLMSFYLGQSFRLASTHQDQIELGLSIIGLLSLFLFVNKAFLLRVRKSILRSLIAGNLLLALAIPFFSNTLICGLVLAQCAILIAIHIFLYRSKKNLPALTASLVFLLVSCVEDASGFFFTDNINALISPYFILALALIRAKGLKKLFQLEDSNADIQEVLESSAYNDSVSEGESGEDPLITEEISRKSLECFSVYMDSLQTTLFQMSNRVQKTLSRQDDQLKHLYIHSKTIEEGARLLGYDILAEKIARLTEILVKLIQNLDAHWNPLALGQEIESIRKIGQQYLRLNSKIPNRRLEYMAKNSSDKELKNFRNEDPNLKLPELKRASEIAKKSFDFVAWLDFSTTLKMVAGDSLSARTGSGEAFLTLENKTAKNYTLNYDDLSHLRSIIDLIIDNSVKHGFESSYERIIKSKAAPSHIMIELREVKDRVVLRIQDDGRGLGILSLREWAHEDRLLDREKSSDLNYYAKLLVLKGWRAPRGLTQVVEIAEALDSKVDIVLYPEMIQNGHCPFALEISIPLTRLSAAHSAPHSAFSEIKKAI
ncbi:MAG: hypothetical protein EOP07_07870 [Proteobacteria bacterium]|nr:MAG: hypothetical protein EOP07_07870 [Pseudomonadota bacterium]